MRTRNRMSMVRPLWTSALVVAAVVVLLTLASSQNEEKPTPTFTGWDKCSPCHKDKADKWTVSTHAVTTKTEGLPQSLAGCEGCHGPGSAHVQGDKTAIGNLSKMAPAESRSVCLKCHGIDSQSVAPKEWQKLDLSSWRRSGHGKGEVSCLSCHAEHASKTKPLLKKEADELCVDCHTVAKPNEGEKIHVPYEKGQCTLCHDPHGSKFSASLKPNMQEVCLSCHDVKDVQDKHSKYGFPMEKADCTRCHQGHRWDEKSKGVKKNLHKPFADGKCNLCHGQTTTDDPFPLVKPVKDLCTTCHSMKSLLSAAGDTDRDKKNGSIHPPVKSGLCTNCHEPHASNYDHLFKASYEQTCLPCHSKVEESMASKFKHKPVASGNCTMCHHGHASKTKKLLVKDTVVDLCKQCHVKEHSTSHPYGEWEFKGKGRKTVKDPRTGKMMTCVSCHGIHGAEHPFITPADPQRDLCIQCHNKELQGEDAHE